MTLRFFHDIRTRNGQMASDAAFHLKEKLKLYGWTVLRSGTGTSGTTAASDLITTNIGTAIGSMARADAWYMIQSPSLETMIVQCNLNQMRFWYSRVDGFPGAGHTATVPARQSPVTDEWAPAPQGNTYTSFGTSGIPYHLDIIVSDVNVGSIYPFWLVARTPSSTSNLGMILFVDAIDPVTLPPGDSVNVAIYCDNATPNDIETWFTTYHGNGGAEIAVDSRVFHSQWYAQGLGITSYPGREPPSPSGRSRLLPLAFSTVGALARGFPQMKGTSVFLRTSPRIGNQGSDSFYWCGANKAFAQAGSICYPVDPARIWRKPVE